MLADLTKNTRVTIDTALNFINGLSETNPHAISPEDNAEIRLKAKQIAQDLNIDNAFSSIEKAATLTRRRKHASPRRQPSEVVSQSSLSTLHAFGMERSKLYAEAQAKTRRLEEEIREEIIAQRARELAERQRIRIQEEARLMVEKEREKTAKIMAEQKERYRAEALEKCATMMARRRQVILATQIIISWKAHVKAQARNETRIKEKYRLYLLRAAFHAWLSNFLFRREEYERERQRLRMETLKSRMRMAETNYVVMLMKKALLAMRVETQRRQTRRRQEEQRACRERRIQSFIQRIEVSKSLCLSQNDLTAVSSKPSSPPISHTEPSNQQQGCTSIPSEEQQSHGQKDVTNRPSTPAKKVRFEGTEVAQTSSVDDPTTFPEAKLVVVPTAQQNEQPGPRKLIRKAPQTYVDYSKRAAERKQERLRRLEEDRLAKEQAEHSQRVLQEELARQKAQVRKEQLETAISCHAGLLLRIGFRSLTVSHIRLSSWRTTSAQRMVHCVFSNWAQRTREKLGKKVEALRKVDDIIGHIMNRVIKQTIFLKGFLPLLQHSKYRFLQAEKFFTLNLLRRSFISMQQYVHQVDHEAQLQGERFRIRIIGRTIIFAWRRAILELRRERIANARQTEIYKLMRAQVAVRWEEMVDRFILESFPSFYDRFEPVVRSFDEIIDSSSLEALAEATLCQLLRPSDNLRPQLPAPRFPPPSNPVQTYSTPQPEQPDVAEYDSEEVDFGSLAALISAAKQITGQSASSNRPELEFTYDFSAATSRSYDVSTHIPSRAMP